LQAKKTCPGIFICYNRPKGLIMNKIIGFLLVLTIGIGIGWVLNNYKTRPCILEERRIINSYGFLPGQDDDKNSYTQRLRNASMYAELEVKGCPEHASMYKERSDEELSAARDIAITNIGNLVTISMDVSAQEIEKFKNTVNDVAEDVANKVGNFVDRIKNTRIEIVVD
jgi:hypothetical protein